MSGASAWMPLYIGDYLGDTQRLTCEQHGAYLLILMDYWRNGPPPADDAVLAQICRLAPAAWRRIKPVILRYFEERNGELHHGRVDHELAKAAENQQRRSAKAKKAADARWQGGDDAPSNARSNAPSNARGHAPRCPPPSPSSEDKSSGVPPPDPVKALFDLGVSVFMAAGKSEEEARALVGKLRKDFGDARAASLLLEARSKSDPVGWLQGCKRTDTDDRRQLYDSIDRKYPRVATG
jgi:uncharacterized protein YdaU (DUF1376 family)